MNRLTLFCIKKALTHRVFAYSDKEKDHPAGCHNKYEKGIRPFPASGSLRSDFRFAQMRTTATSCHVLHPDTDFRQKKNTPDKGCSFFGGSEGIRTPEPVKTTRFPIVPVMTTSIRFLISARLFASVFYILYFFERFVKYFIGLFSINLYFENCFVATEAKSNRR